ncbi:MAG TPA: DUF4129 domain-containing protein [Candidatus Rubrimentiphilum sp.]|nr:DUF4129 domain-containing protein [Candidatus Rubrimentiphilum sp.]
MSAAPVLVPRLPPIDPSVLARKILLEDRFRVAIPTTHRTAWEIFWTWVRDQWSRLSDVLFSHVQVGRQTGVALGYLLVIALVVIILIVGARLMAGAVRDAQRAGRSQPLADTPDFESLYERSCLAALRGDYRAAIALIFWAALLKLERMGVIWPDPSRTVNECRRAVARGAPAAAPEFDKIARSFTAAFYAERAVAPEQWESARDGFMALNA